MVISVETRVNCVLYGATIETVSHLLCHCRVVVQLRSRVVGRKGRAWCVPENLCELLMEWDELCVMFDKALWPLVPYALCWSLWLGRNGVIFSNEETTLEGFCGLAYSLCFLVG